METVERRSFKARELRMEASSDGKGKKIVGYASVFNQPSEELVGEDSNGRAVRFRELVMPGCFKNTLAAGADVRALIDHDASRILGRTKAGTCSLREDETGLEATITPPDTTYARDLEVCMQRGDVDQMSFGFKTKRDAWKRDAAGGLVRELHEAELLDVSVVTFPAYPQTSVAMRSLTASAPALVVETRVAAKPEASADWGVELRQLAAEMSIDISGEMWDLMDDCATVIYRCSELIAWAVSRSEKMDAQVEAAASARGAARELINALYCSLPVRGIVTAAAQEAKECQAACGGSDPVLSACAEACGELATDAEAFVGTLPTEAGA